MGKSVSKKRKVESIEKIQRVSVTEQVYNILVKKITSGEWKTGQKIPSEIELAEKLGISRASLKMALQKLNILGITETRVGEGTFVKEFDMSSYLSELFKSNILCVDSKELNEFRSLLEFNLMHLAILNPNNNEETFDLLENIMQEMKNSLLAGRTEDYHQFHYQFHRIICEMSGNQMFIQLYNAVQDSFFEVYKHNSERTWKIHGVEESINFHRRVLDALKNRDAAACLNLQNELITDKNLQES